MHIGASLAQRMLYLAIFELLRLTYFPLTSDSELNKVENKLFPVSVTLMDV